MTAILRQIQCAKDPIKNTDCCTNPGFCDWHAFRRCASIQGCINHFPNRYVTILHSKDTQICILNTYFASLCLGRLFSKQCLRLQCSVNHSLGTQTQSLFTQAWPTSSYCPSFSQNTLCVVLPRPQPEPGLLPGAAGVQRDRTGQAAPRHLRRVRGDARVPQHPDAHARRRLLPLQEYHRYGGGTSYFMHCLHCA